MTTKVDLVATGQELRTLVNAAKAKRRQDITDEERARIESLQKTMRQHLGHHQRAVDVIHLEDGYSDEDLSRAAATYETNHGVPLIHSDETDLDDDGVWYPNEHFAARLLTFKHAPRQGVTGDPEITRRELRKALELLAKRKDAATPAEQQHVHELQRDLGEPLTDFSVALRGKRA